MFFTIIIFILILGVLVLVHELGHFISAKRSGMTVEEFGFGFPPRLFGMQRRNGKLKFIFGHQKDIDKSKTVYSINVIPLGGFVRILGENNDAEALPGAFITKSFSARLITLLAGVLMNVLLAWALFSVGYMVGLPVGIDQDQKVPSYATLSNPQPVILEVENDSPASKAGLHTNDIIKKIDGQSFTTSDNVKTYIGEHKGNTFAFLVQRGSDETELTVASDANPPQDRGSVGITMTTLAKLRLPVHRAIWEGAVTTVNQLYAIVHGLYSLIKSHAGLSSLGGPVKIAQMTGEVAGLGFIYLVQFTAFLSLNLAILNTLPFPALDGGRVLFLVIEKLRGKPNNPRLEQYANTIGFFLLLALMVIITTKDLGFFK